MNTLNPIEMAVLEQVAKKYSSISSHIGFLQVSERKNTGVGMYVNFHYQGNLKNIKLIDPPNASLSSNHTIEVNNLIYGLGFEVDIKNGKINFIEFITYNELWDGSISEFHFVENK